MKRILIAIALCACVLTAAQAQGTFDFYATLTGTSEIPPNSDPTVTTGTLSLSGNLLSFRLDVPLITFIARSAYIQGPALPGSTGPTIFDLGGPVFQGGSPEFGIPPSYVFFSPYTPPFGAGPFTLTDQQINELMSGLWYMNVTSSDFPNGQIRGQILLVPELSAWILIVLGGLILGMLRRFSLGPPVQ